MGRLEFSLTTRIIFLMALGTLAGCGIPPQTVSNLQYSASAQPLIGATPTALSAEFGQPTLLRVDGTAQVWLYQTAGCGLNLILYPDTSGTPRVTMVSAAGGSDAPVGCTASLQQAHLEAINPAATSAALQVPDIAALEHPGSS